MILAYDWIRVLIISIISMFKPARRRKNQKRNNCLVIKFLWFIMKEYYFSQCEEGASEVLSWIILKNPS